MAMPGDFISPITTCMNPTMTWPEITQPGLPNFTAGLFASCMAGINFVLQFIPPTPQSIAGLSIPSVTIFQDAFMASINLGSLTDPSAALKFIELGYKLPFMLVSTMVTDLLQLKITLPTVQGIIDIVASLSVSIGISGTSVTKFGGCIAQGIVDLFTGLIPV